MSGGRLLSVVDANAQEAPPADLAVWRPSTGGWWVMSSQWSQAVNQQWGSSGDIPTPGDYDDLNDDLNRLKSATETNGGSETWKQTFEIDRYGNREFDPANTTTLGSCATAVCNPNINTSDNRFSAAQGYSYDLNGNVTQDAAGQRFGYDAENHQKEFFAAGNSTSTPDATYLYDGQGRRVKKTSSTETTVFVYNASGQLVAEYSTQTAQTPQVSYLTTDHLGSPRIVTNENGTVKDRKDYSAFGEESVSAQRNANSEYSAVDQLRKDYTGYEKDGESGLEFAQARYYNPTHGRFTSADPLMASASIRNPQTFNRYSYVLNSPYKFVDPLGLRPESLSNFKSRVINAINGKGTLSESDLELAKFHIRNGSALGYAFLSASYTEITRQNTNNSNTVQPINAGLHLSKDGREMLAAEGMEGTRTTPYDNDGAKGKNCTVGVGHLLAPGPCNSKDPNHTRTYSQAEIDQFLDADIENAE